MCGIVGILSRSQPVDPSALHRMTDTLTHRGPDQRGTWISVDGLTAFGHRRLSILDLSEGAGQPFKSTSGRTVLVYNGEVYNHSEIANKSIAHLNLKTTGDTEVVCESLEARGMRALDDLNGMYAMAWHDIESKRTYLARDHAGIKPLFYYPHDHGLSFASELRALKSLHPELKEDLKTISSYLTLGFFSGADTAYKGVYKLRAGQTLTWDGNTHETSAKKALVAEKKSIIDESKALDELDTLMRKSVSTRLVADRATGVFLSGGIDSSLVAMYASEVSESKVPTYCLKINGSPKDESGHAQAIADILGTTHHTIPLDERQIKDRLLNTLDHQDEPFGDSSILPTSVLTEFVSDHVTVALAGDGGDELFMGYGMYTWAERLSKTPIPMVPLAYRLLKWFGPKKDKEYSKYFRYDRRSLIPYNIISQEMGCFHHGDLSRLMPSQLIELPSAYSGEMTPAAIDSPGERQSYLDFLNYLPDDLLTKVDRASMQHSMEVRVPFLDKSIVDWAYALPVEFKVGEQGGKALLKKALARRIPNELVYRQKWGFSIPLHQWLLGDFDFLIDDHLSESALADIEWLDTTEVKRLVELFRSGHHYLYMRLWLLIQLVRWLKKI